MRNLKKQILSILSLVICIALLTVNLKLFSVSYPYNILQNYFHVIIFIFLTVTIYTVILSPNFKIWITGIIALILAFSTEIFQIFSPRDADFIDLLLNFSGIAIAILWISFKNMSQGIKRRYFKTGFILLILIIMASFLFNFASIAYTQFKFSKMLPILADFECEWELKRWKGNNNTKLVLSNDFSTSGKSCLKVKFNTFIYPRIIPECAPKDWSKYRKFSFDVFNPQKETIDMFLRFDDNQSVDYASQGLAGVKLIPGKNHIRLAIDDIEKSPSSGRLNMKKIDKVIFFLYKPEKSYTLFIDYVRFE